MLICDLDGERCEAVAAEIRAAGAGMAQGLETDVADRAQLERAVAVAVSTWGRLDILVNNAMWMGKGGPSGGMQGTVVELDEESWDYAFAVGLKSQFLLTKLVVPHMQTNASQSHGGSIVNISSVEGYDRGIRCSTLPRGACHCCIILYDAVRVHFR